MASGRPVLAAVDPGSDAWNLIQEAEAGLCVEPENPTELRDAIAKLYHDPTLRQQFGENGRAFVEQHYTRAVAGEKYHQLLNSLIQVKAQE